MTTNLTRMFMALQNRNYNECVIICKEQYIYGVGIDMKNGSQRKTFLVELTTIGRVLH